MGTGKIIQADNIDGIKVQKNFISNGNATLNTSGWATYKDAVQSRPENGTGGSPTLVSISRTTTSPLSDAASFLFSVTGGSSARGEGASYDFTIDAAYKAKVLKIEADYIVNSGTFAAGSSTTDSDVICYIYDITNGVLIEPSSFKFLSNSTTISDKFSATFQTSATGTQYRLIFHVASTSTAAYALKFDNVSVSPSQYVYGTPITDWVSYTPTVSGLGTGGVASSYGKWRMVGDSIEITYNWTKDGSGGSGSSTVITSAPSGITMDTSKTPNGSNIVSGEIYTGLTTRYVQLVDSATGGAYSLNVATGANLTGSGVVAGTNVRGSYNFPVLGWSSSVQVSDGYEGRVVAAFSSGSNAGGGAIPTTFTNIPFTNVKDTTGSWDSANNYYIVPSSGWYEVDAKIEGSKPATFGVGNYLWIEVSLGGSFIDRFISRATLSTQTVLIASGNTKLYAKAGQIIRIQGLSNTTGAVYAASDSSCSFSISKLSGHPTISAVETIGALYTGAPPTGTLGAAWNTVTFGTKVKDSHGAYSSGSYTVPSSGQYDISAQVVISSASQAVGDFFGISIFIDGVESHTGAWNAQTTVTSVPARPKVDIKAIPLRGGQLVTIRSYAQSNTPIFVTSATQNFFSITRSGGY